MSATRLYWGWIWRFFSSEKRGFGMGVLEGINQVLDGICGQDLQRRLAALRQVCDGTLPGEVIVQNVMRVLREDMRSRGFVVLECEREYRRLRQMVMDWEITLEGEVVGQYVTYAEAVDEYRQLELERAGKLSLHRLEAEVQVREVRRVGDTSVRGVG